MRVVDGRVVAVAEHREHNGPVVRRNVPCAPEQDERDAEIEDDGDAEDALFEPRRVRVDVCYVDGVAAEGCEEGGELGRGGDEGVWDGEFGRLFFDGAVFGFRRHGDGDMSRGMRVIGEALVVLRGGRTGGAFMKLELQVWFWCRC